MKNDLHTQDVDEEAIKKLLLKSRAEEAEAALYEAVTDDAPYSDTAEYKMVSYLSDDENENKKNLLNSQGS